MANTLAWRPGCGPGNWEDWFVPDVVPGVYDFLDIYLDHDICYETCGTTKVECDNVMCSRMLAQCFDTHGDGPLLSFCRIAAWTYCSAIEDLVGVPYENAQAD